MQQYKRFYPSDLKDKALQKIEIGDLEVRVLKQFPSITRMSFSDSGISFCENGKGEGFDTLTHCGIKEEGKDYDVTYSTAEEALDVYEKILTNYIKEQIKDDEQYEIIWRAVPEFKCFSSRQYSEPEDGPIRLLRERDHYVVYSRLKIFPRKDFFMLDGERNYQLGDVLSYNLEEARYEWFCSTKQQEAKDVK